MNIKKLVKPTAYILLLCGLVGVFIFKSQTHSAAQSKQNGSAFATELYTRTHNGIGQVRSQVGSGYNQNSRITGIDPRSVSQFIHDRAGITMNEGNIQLLSGLEDRTLAGQQPLISTTYLANVISGLCFKRLSSLGQSDLSNMVETLKGFDDPNLPPSVRAGRNKGLKLRATSLDDISAQEAMSKLKALKDPNAQTLMNGQFTQYIKQSVEERLMIWMGSSPEQFSQTNSPYSSSFGGLTPGQAFVLAYSFISEDHLFDSMDSLNANMWAVKGTLDKLDPANPYPSPVNHFAYGQNGYLYSSPTNLFFDDTVQTLLIKSLGNIK